MSSVKTSLRWVVSLSLAVVVAVLGIADAQPQSPERVTLGSTDTGSPGAVPVLDELSDLGDPYLRWQGGTGSKAGMNVRSHGKASPPRRLQPCSHARILRTDAP